jgi:hypothetical protein
VRAAPVRSEAIRSRRSNSDEAPAGAAYGLRLTGVDGAGLLDVLGGEDFPSVNVVRDVGPVPHDPRWHIRFGHGSFPVGSGRVHAERTPATATMRSARPLADDEVVHPWLSRVAGIFGHWLGRETLHGGAFVAGGGAWAVVGGSEAGKSTLLAAMATRGHEVLTDDVLVVCRGLGYAGPRCVDLRPGTATAIGVGDVRPCRGGTRHRLRLPPAPAAMPLAGVVHLGWGHSASVAPLALPDRVARLRGQSWLGPANPLAKHTLLDLAALPTFELVRPRRLEDVGEGVAMLLGAVGD